MKSEREMRENCILRTIFLVVTFLPFRCIDHVAFVLSIQEDVALFAALSDSFALCQRIFYSHIAQLWVGVDQEDMFEQSDRYAGCCEVKENPYDLKLF